MLVGIYCTDVLHISIIALPSNLRYLFFLFHSHVPPNHLTMRFYILVAGPELDFRDLPFKG